MQPASARAATDAAVLPDGFTYERITIPAPSLGDSLLGEPAEQELHVILPPGYAGSAQRYPVLYYFAGYWENEDPRFLSPALPQAMEEQPYIIVSVKDNNRLHGTFGANSPVTGNWWDFYVNDVIPAVDARYRTIPERSGRAVAGFSMGGHIALRLAFAHPELFATLYTVSPGVFAPDGLETAWPLWDDDFRAAYGAAYAPNPDKSFPHADIPTMDGSAEDLAIRARWNSGFGELPQMVADYRAGKQKLDSIYIEVGLSDYYQWIPQGCRYLSDLLAEAQVPHTLRQTTRNHEFDAAVFAAGMAPAISRAFADSTEAAVE